MRAPLCFDISQVERDRAITLKAIAIWAPITYRQLVVALRLRWARGWYVGMLGIEGEEDVLRCWSHHKLLASMLVLNNVELSRHYFRRAVMLMREELTGRDFSILISTRWTLRQRLCQNRIHQDCVRYWRTDSAVAGSRYGLKIWRARIQHMRMVHFWRLTWQPRVTLLDLQCALSNRYGQVR